MKTIKTFEDACNVVGIDPAEALPNLENINSKYIDQIIAYTKLLIIVEALNDGWKPDWGNLDQEKFQPWFDRNENTSGGSEFIVYGDGWSFSAATSNLCFKTSDLAGYAAETFTDIYNDFFKALK